MKSIYILLSLVSATAVYQAQSVGNSPYAAYGIGDMKYDNSIDQVAMGGIGTAYISDLNNSFNFMNPAANFNMEITSIRAQMTNENNYYATNYGSGLKTTKHSNYFSNFSIAFPVSKKVKMGFTFQPYSSKNYNIIKNENINSETIKATSFRGNGTVNTLQWATSYKLNANLGLGLRANYYFGNLTDLEEIGITNAEYISGYETKNTVKAYNFTLASVYQKKLKNDTYFNLGATYTLGTGGKLQTSYTNSTYYYQSVDVKGNESIIEQKTSLEKNLLPQEFSLGLGYGKEYKWFWSGQIDVKKGNVVNFLGQSFQNQDSYRISAGGWMLPNFNNFRNYFSRVIYRYGVYYEKGNLQISNTNINEMGLSLGVNLPFKKSNINKLNSIDIAVELGKRGTTNNNLIQQNFINFKFGFNFADKWFNKRYYN